MNQSSSKKLECMEEQSKFLYWIVKWLNKEEGIGQTKFDLPELTVIMQLLGFKLQKFEKLNAIQDSDNEITLIFTCNTSGMRSILSKTSEACKCPVDEDVAKGQFWSVTGFSPASQEHINRSTSSLLPSISQSKSKLIITLLSGALFVIESASNDVKQKQRLPEVTINSSPFKRSFSLDAIRLKEVAALRQRGLKRQHSWEIDPNTSPPADTSSPVPLLCNSMGQISLRSGNSDSLLKNLQLIQKLVSDSIHIAAGCRDSTYTKQKIRSTESHANEESKPPAGFENTFITPRRILTPRKFNSVTEKKPSSMIPCTKQVSVKQRTGFKSSPVVIKKATKDSPRLSIIKKNNSCEKVIKSKIAAYIGLTPKSSTKVGKSAETNSSKADPRFRKVVTSLKLKH